jgi:hypothetical protein
MQPQQARLRQRAFSCHISFEDITPNLGPSGRGFFATPLPPVSRGIALCYGEQVTITRAKRFVAHVKNSRLAATALAARRDCAQLRLSARLSLDPCLTWKMITRMRPSSIQSLADSARALIRRYLGPIGSQNAVLVTVISLDPTLPIHIKVTISVASIELRLAVH